VKVVTIEVRETEIALSSDGKIPFLAVDDMERLVSLIYHAGVIPEGHKIEVWDSRSDQPKLTLSTPGESSE
jgi:hypothetical protein